MKITGPFSHATIAAVLIPLIAGSPLASAPNSSPWETTTKDILISEIQPFNLASHVDNLESSTGLSSKRSSWSTGVCNQMNVHFKPVTGGLWHFKAARCDRTGTDVNTFTVDCFGGRNWIEEHIDKPGKCGPREWCVDFRGINNKGDGTNDVYCVKRADIHTWVANTFANPVDDHVTCSRKWTNDSPRSAKAQLLVDVMDNAGKDYISPQNVFFTINKKWVGNSKGGDAIVGSGVITIPPRADIYACVTAIMNKGQILNIMAALTLLSYV
ncbi:predicted protein [Plenodomus lingam JN3]|uniref:Predicted protein n=1 Tax=Leptosphaeria maculans (strain JN3 / isolate v23.1.3 / race Av1-4-5-6-7-8) TaxID=985895 RepID=E4ZZ88_LEPMJ|nr:predicted protein [Plenodomus lingam JN3]CBX96683.1 predicted protein [Plenodomus lingam JN3]